MNGHVHINFVRYTKTWVSVNYCPTCERMRRMLAQYQEWYGVDITCCGCGEKWQDGEHLERPFCRGWRKENIEHARKVLANIGVNL